MANKDTEVRFQIIINVVYEKETVGDPDLFVRDLTSEFDRVIGEGLLTPSRSEVVEEFDTEVRYEGDEEQGW
jgi:hypothetical protein